MELDVLTAVITKSSLFYDMTPCSPLKVSRNLGKKFRVCHQGWRVSRGRNLEDGDMYLLKSSIEFQETVRNYIPEEIILHSQYFFLFAIKCSREKDTEQADMQAKS
jgi:hypothetical protein